LALAEVAKAASRKSGHRTKDPSKVGRDGLGEALKGVVVTTGGPKRMNIISSQTPYASKVDPAASYVVDKQLGSGGVDRSRSIMLSIFACDVQDDADGDSQRTPVFFQCVRCPSSL
jgi:hypothetical protein